MDPTAILGIIFGMWILVKAIGLDVGIKLFMDPSGLMIVFGGIFSAILVHFPITQIFKIIPRLKAIFFVKSRDYFKDINQISTIAEKIKKEGRLSVNKDLEKIDDHFLRSTLQLFIDKVPADELELMMKENINAIEERHEQGIIFFEQLAKYAPGFGLVGTLIGLIIMLAKLEDPTTLGKSMSIGLCTSFYGVLLSNLIFLPLAGRLRISSYEEIFEKEMMLKGIISMAEGDPVFIVREKMLMFLSDKDRRKVLKKTQKTSK